MNPNSSQESLNSALDGRYRVERELGAGGMATVYLAHDLRHERDVAIKVLHPDLGAALGAERFDKEIKTTAKLQHPHILPLLDSGNANGLLFYVMPLVSGETLRSRLERERQLPINDSLRIAREVADALDHAHKHGVIHRDIKPENILLQDGHALVADFGIALAVQTARTSRMTATGMSLGTPQYMSPEQAMGEANIDARSDIYALGVVLYEMLAGDPPFTGSSVQAIVAKVLSEKPASIRRLRDTVSVVVESAVLTALAKLPADRFQSVADFGAALRNDNSSAHSVGAHVEPRTSARLFNPVLALGVLCLALTLLAVWQGTRPRVSAETSRAYLKFPDDEAPVVKRPSYAIFPDGRAIVYVGKSATGTQLWIKKRSELHATPIAGTEGATNAFVSPDGAWIGFINETRVMKVATAGGTPVPVSATTCSDTDCSFGEGGTFLEDGSVVYSAAAAIVISPPGAERADTLVTSTQVGGLDARQPSTLPNGRGVLFTACTLRCNRADVWVYDFASKAAHLLVSGGAYPIYVPTGHVLYRDAKGSVLAAGIDLKSLKVAGKPVPVLDHVGGPLAIARNGTMLYADGDPSPRSELMFVSREGTSKSIDTTWRANFSTLAVSPDGTRIATTIVHNNGEEHLWVKTINGGAPVRLTFDAGQHTSPTWTADGKSILFNRFVDTLNYLMMRTADGLGQAEVLQHSSNWVIESAVSRDGVWRIQREYHRTDGTRDIFARRVSGDTSVLAVVKTPASDYSPTLSPDGKWLAYSSEDGGSVGIWVVPFPVPGGSRWQISQAGGSEPTWSSDGTELFYISPTDSLVAVSVSGITGVKVGSPRALFSVKPYRRFFTHRAYDVRPANAGFVMIRDGTPPVADLALVENWFPELRRTLGIR